MLSVIGMLQEAIEISSCRPIDVWLPQRRSQAMLCLDSCLLPLERPFLIPVCVPCLIVIEMAFLARRDDHSVLTKLSVHDRNCQLGRYPVINRIPDGGKLLNGKGHADFFDFSEDLATATQAPCE